MQYRPRRVPSRQEVTIATGDGPVRSKVVNVSPGGIRLWLSAPSDLPKRIDLRAGGTTLSGQIVWRLPQEIGVAFDRPLDARSFAILSGSGARNPNRSGASAGGRGALRRR